MEPCDLHELTNCALCNGVAARFEDSLSDDRPEPDDPLPIVPGAAVIRAQFGGTCARCGRRYQQYAVIVRHYRQDIGWVAYDCCA